MNQTLKLPPGFPAAPPKLTSERLVLRSITESDTDACAAIFSDLDYARMTSSLPHPYHPLFIYGWLAYIRGALRRGERLEWAVTLKDTGQLIGVIGLFKRAGAANWEIGYGLGRDHWGAGYATETARTVIDWARETMKIDEIHAGHFVDNPASGRILEKLGFARVGEPVPMWSLARGEKSPGLRYVWPADRATTVANTRLH